jgi:hypothetical protein
MIIGVSDKLGIPIANDDKIMYFGSSVTLIYQQNTID